MKGFKVISIKTGPDVEILTLILLKICFASLKKVDFWTGLRNCS
jgi:hypothetical protein